QLSQAGQFHAIGVSQQSVYDPTDQKGIFQVIDFLQQVRGFLVVAVYIVTVAGAIPDIPLIKGEPEFFRRTFAAAHHRKLPLLPRSDGPWSSSWQGTSNCHCLSLLGCCRYNDAKRERPRSRNTVPALRDPNLDKLAWMDRSSRRPRALRTDRRNASAARHRPLSSHTPSPSYARSAR